MFHISRPVIGPFPAVQLAKERTAWLHLLWPMTIPLLVVIACLVCKLHFDLQRVRLPYSNSTRQTCSRFQTTWQL